MRCEGWRRRGGVFTLGPVKWSQCENDAIVALRVKQETEQELPSCMKCWREAVERGIDILKSHPLAAEDKLSVDNGNIN